MELFMLVSSIGTLILLATHMVDYARDVMRRSAEGLGSAVRKSEVAMRGVAVPGETVEQYDRAA
jgi:hypothetical protein